jgi:hypothetical protein
LSCGQNNEEILSALPTSRQKAEFLRQLALERAGHACEGSPAYPHCRARADRAHPETDKPVTLLVINFEPGVETLGNKRVMCNRCVLAYDFPLHCTQGWRQRRKAMGNLEMFPID